MTKAGGRFMELLVVDDDPDDARFLVEGFRKAAVPVRVRTAPDVDEALKILLDPSALRLPDLVLLDIRMPGKSGFELLERIRGASEPLRCLPVIMLSTSSHPEDVRRAYCGFANSYIQKPADLAGYERLARSVFDFWSGTATLSGH